MYSYTNKKLEVVEVSKEHLDTAVEIKVALQKASPSQKCSWAQHRKLMIKEGFYDSENSEAYRQLIKRYQASIGELPSAQKYADMVATSKLVSLRDLVGDMAWEKHENKKYLKDINKGKKEIIDGSLFIQEVKAEIHNTLSQVRWEEIMSHVFSPVEKRTNTRAILLLTDWHIGALVDVEGNQYNYEIAVERINNAVNEAVMIAELNGVYRMDVVYCGDILEHAYMRNAQAYHAEFPVSKQMTLGGKLLIEVLTKLSNKFFVTYRGFAGNHDRMNGDKNANIDGDTGMVVVNELVETFITASKIENLVYVPTHHFHASLIDVNGRNFKFVHGDLESKGDFKKIKYHSSDDGVTYHVIAYGHFHHYMALEVGIDKWEIRIGSTKGSDDYSEKFKLGSAPSQGLILVTEEGKILPYRLSC